MCGCTCVDMHLCLCVEARGPLSFLKMLPTWRVSQWSRTCQLSQAGWPMSPRGLPVSASPASEWQGQHCAGCLSLTLLVLGIELGSSRLHIKLLSYQAIFPEEFPLIVIILPMLHMDFYVIQISKWAPRNCLNTDPKTLQEAEGDWKGLCGSSEISCKMRLDTKLCNIVLWKLRALSPLWI